MCGGAGLAFSKSLVHNITYNIDKLSLSFSNGIGKRKKKHSDVVLTHFIRSKKLGRLINRPEFKNFPPRNVANFYNKQKNKKYMRSSAVSFHHLSNLTEFEDLYNFYYKNDNICSM